MGAEAVFMRGGNLLRVCELTDSAGDVVRAEPYAIYTSLKHRRFMYFYQLSEPAGFRSIEAKSLVAAKLLEDRFQPRREYQPMDKTVFPAMHFSIPTHDGKQRWVDKVGEADKAKLPLRPHFEG